MTRYVQGNSTGTFTVKNVGGVQTLSAGINDGQTAYWSADPTSATRRMLFADIIKGSPNYSINMFYCNTAASGNDALDTDFRTQVLLASPSFTNHQFTAGVGALAFDQVAGVLDCVNVTWELYSVRFHICDLAAVVIS
jgi:hypothetical protein